MEKALRNERVFRERGGGISRSKKGRGDEGGK